MDKCPICGYNPLANTTQQVFQPMNEYLDDKTGKPYGVIQAKDDFLTLTSGQVLRKKGVEKKKVVTEPTK